MLGSQTENAPKGSTAPDSADLFHWLCVVVMVLLAAGIFSVYLWDSDYWWHIAAGRDIWLNGRIPDQDPFGVFATPDPVRAQTVLKAQWLGQVLLYLAHHAGGVDAAVALRVALLSTTLLLVHLRARALGARGGALWLLSAATALLLFQNTGTRPNLFTIFCVTLLFLVLETARRQPQGTTLRAVYLLSLPFIGWVWANLHGGYVLGSVLLILLSGLSLYGSLVSKGAAFDRSLALATLAYLAITLLTPNLSGSYLYLLGHETSELTGRTSEYVSALRIYSLGYLLPQVWVGGFYLLAIAAAFTRALRAAPEQWLVVLALALAAVTAYRYMILFVCVSAPYLAAALTPAGRRLAARLPQALSRRGEFLLLAALLALGLWYGARGALFQGGLVPQRYPEAAVAQLAQREVRGRVFSTLEWGGYLLWHLHPALTPYIDGRMLQSARLRPYTHMLWATPEGIPQFAAADFDYVLLPERGRFNRDPYALPLWLARSPDWQLVWTDPATMIFQRRR